MPHELALQAREAVLQADDNFLKIGRIVATFLKIVRIFQNRDVLGVIWEENTCEETNMRLILNLEKSAIKLENSQESALILEKELFKKIRYSPIKILLANSIAGNPPNPQGAINRAPTHSALLRSPFMDNSPTIS